MQDPRTVLFWGTPTADHSRTLRRQTGEIPAPIEKEEARWGSDGEDHVKVVVSNIFYFHTYLGKIPSLTNIFQMGGSTTNQMSLNHLPIFSHTQMRPMGLVRYIYLHMYPQKITQNVGKYAVRPMEHLGYSWFSGK